MGDVDKLVKDQNDKISAQKSQVAQKTSMYTRRANHQADMYMAVKYFNQFLIFFYLFLFTLIHVLFLEQYMRGIERSEFWDTIWLTFFFLYPYFIFLVEEYVYFGIAYVISFIYGQTYVHEFDKILLMTDFYAEPTPTTL
jgi:hypothetical protein